MKIFTFGDIDNKPILIQIRLIEKEEVVVDLKMEFSEEVKRVAKRQIIEFIKCL